ncbi:zinc finger CCCH domain-containing protein 25-like [Melia azedarach]|uniref:Zinc finger CCCH domain-containing protein 25-like n=1 Tax=Melia azedarach TaxID=155640 RepID=A0ACC1YRE1_MELAZ|nr:zinc finger CCCH domain-containing protein 25-like [Melia azedarach]
MNPLTLVKRIQNINSKEAALGISDDASWHAKYKDSAYVFVGGIPFDLTEGDLLAVFAQYGEIVDVNLVRDKGTGKSKGFAFIAYEDQRSTILAVDNLNGAQILGRIIRVDHVSNYKKKEEEDEETRQRKREERGVCRAFQRGECTRGDGCKFSHDEQRAANTGGGPQDRGSRWGHEKFEGNKEGSSWGNKDSSSRAVGSGRALDGHPKQSDTREEKRSRRHDDIEKPREDHNRREEKRSIKHDVDEFELNSREDRYSREGKKSRRHLNDESELRSGDQSRPEEKRLRRHGGDSEFEPRSREDHYRREEMRYTRHESESYSREDRNRRGDKLSTRHGESSSLRQRERDDHRHKSDR